MKTNVASTSIAAYRELDLAECERKVLAFMQPGKAYTDREIAHALNQVPSWVSARRNRLIEAGLVEFNGNVRCPITGKTVKAHKLAAVQMALELA